MEQKTGISTGAARRFVGIRNVAYGPTSMVGSQRCSRDASFHGNGVEVSIMGHDHPRWRIRLSTLMLLVVIAALATYIVVERWQRVQEARRLAAEAQQAFAALQQAEAQARRASSSAQAGTSPTADK
jgi:hypothetical protein